MDSPAPPQPSLISQRQWRQLLDAMADGKLVPIVGQDLLTFKQADGSVQNLYSILAKNFCERCDLTFDESACEYPLARAFAQHPDFRTASRYNVYDELQDLMDEVTATMPDPEPLLHLAEMRHLRIFVSTTFDHLLERTLNRVRHGGKPKTRVLTYSPRSVPKMEEIDSALSSGSAVLLQLFGSYRRQLEYAVSEVDILEFMHNLQSREFRPERFFQELADKHLLLLGNSFPDWLARFFLRLTKNQELLSDRNKTMQYVTDEHMRRDTYLVNFIKSSTAMTRPLPEISAVDFIGKLHELWNQANPNPEAVEACMTVEKTKLPDGAVFISYSRSDEVAARKLYDVLEAADVDVFLDQAPQGLQLAEDYNRRIRREISRCGIFIPIISQNTKERLTNEPGCFFSKEWNWAIERYEDEEDPDFQFILPVIVDDLDFYDANSQIPTLFKKNNGVKAPAGEPPLGFCQKVAALVKTNRKNRRREGQPQATAA